MADEYRTLPVPLKEAHALRFFETIRARLPAGQDVHVVRRDDGVVCAWTGNPSVEVPPFRVIGADGSGGLAAFWIRGRNAAIETQPIVFLGSEGELKVIARDLDDYLWLMANGVGPLETVDGLDRVPEPIPALVALAQRHTGAVARPVEALIAAAEAALPALPALPAPIESATK